MRLVARGHADPADCAQPSVEAYSRFRDTCGRPLLGNAAENDPARAILDLLDALPGNPERARVLEVVLERLSEHRRPGVQRGERHTWHFTWASPSLGISIDSTPIGLVNYTASDQMSASAEVAPQDPLPPAPKPAPDPEWVAAVA